ncbi:MAG: ATP-binding cassette domain-containing protein [Erysipelotrichales bacterium]|nr:ATP-binding cassette domain-containing protein [Erysipelotrichales bacterium]
MSLIELTNIRFKYTDRELFNDLNFRLLAKEKVALIGANGSGKTTLMNIIAKNIRPDNGQINYLPNLAVSYLDQHLKVDKKNTIGDYLYHVFNELFQKESQMNNYFKALETAKEYEFDSLLEKANYLQEELEREGFYNLKPLIDNVIAGLGLSDIGLDRKIAELSGGQKAKVFLGKILLEKPDVMLLDEPTNFLDDRHVEWLKKFLENYPKSFVLISHDISFLSAVTNVIYELENRSLEKYKGNYNYYLTEKQIRANNYQKSFEVQQAFIKKTEDFIDKNITRASTSNRAKSRQKQLDKLIRIDKPFNNKPVHFDFKFSKEPYQKILEVKELIIGYDKPLLKPINLLINRKERILIKGANGIGKTTFIKTILKFMSQKSGEFSFTNNCDISFFSQEAEFKADETPFSLVLNHFPEMDNVKIRSALGRVGIDKSLYDRPFKALSGGEASKARLLLLSITKSNVLILDEPTNHLDKNAKAALLEALKVYPGTIIMISHELDFFSEIDFRVVSFEALKTKR